MRQTYRATLGRLTTNQGKTQACRAERLDLIRERRQLARSLCTCEGGSDTECANAPVGGSAPSRQASRRAHGCWTPGRASALQSDTDVIATTNVTCPGFTCSDG